MLEIRVSLNAAELDDSAELSRLHQRLRTHLERSGLERVRPVRSSEQTEGARGLQEFLQGVFEGVLLKAINAAVPPLAAALADFVSRSGRSVTVEIDGDKLQIDRPRSKDVERVLTAFLEHHRKDG